MRKEDLRIVRIATFPRKGAEGIGRASYELAERLGYKTLYIARKMGGPPVDHDPNITLKEIEIEDIVLPSMNARDKLEYARLIKKILIYCSFCLKSLPAIFRFKPHVVHIHSILPVASAFMAKIFLGCKIMVSFHGTDILRMRKYRFLPPLIRRFDHVFYVSRAMEPVIKGLVPADKCTYTPNGVDCALFSPARNEREKIIITVGVLKWQKGLDVLLRAFKKFLRDHEDYALEIVGEGPCEDELRTLARELGIERKVLWSGHLSQSELVDRYRRAMFFVLSSLSEGFPKVLVEAMACGCPVICTDAGSCPEIAEGCGVVVRKGSVDELACAMVRVADDSVLRSIIGDRARRRAEEYSWDVAAFAVDKVVKELLDVSEEASECETRETIREKEEDEAFICSG